MGGGRGVSPGTRAVEMEAAEEECDWPSLLCAGGSFVCPPGETGTLDPLFTMGSSSSETGELAAVRDALGADASSRLSRELRPMMSCPL